MTLEDLKYIFQPQIEVIGTTDAKLWFMLRDGDHTLVERHPVDDLAGLLPLLDSFQYAGSIGNMPRFVK
jgi:hypothetical protein